MEQRDDDEPCLICGQPIPDGAGRYRVQDGAAHWQCYDIRHNGARATKARLADALPRFRS